jgi:hypothetical protein
MGTASGTTKAYAPLPGRDTFTGPLTKLEPDPEASCTTRQFTPDGSNLTNAALSPLLMATGGVSRATTG